MKSGKFLTFNRRALNTALASALALAGTGFVSNAYAADGTGTANATVVTPIAIAASNPNLRFGSFSTSAAGQTVAIGTGGARTLVGALGVGTATVLIYVSGAAAFGFHAVSFFSIVLIMTSSFLMQATSATFLALPARVSFS